MVVIMKRILSGLIIVCSCVCMHAQKSDLRVHGDAVQLVVEGEPFLVLGGELGNSSAACAHSGQIGAPPI